MGYVRDQLQSEVLLLTSRASSCTSRSVVGSAAFLRALPEANREARLAAFHHDRIDRELDGRAGPLELAERDARLPVSPKTPAVRAVALAPSARE
jgi:hypothetical protein